MWFEKEGSSVYSCSTQLFEILTVILLLHLPLRYLYKYEILLKYLVSPDEVYLINLAIEITFYTLGYQMYEIKDFFTHLLSLGFLCKYVIKSCSNGINCCI